MVQGLYVAYVINMLLKNILTKLRCCSMARSCSTVTAVLLLISSSRNKSGHTAHLLVPLPVPGKKVRVTDFISGVVMVHAAELSLNALLLFWRRELAGCCAGLHPSYNHRCQNP
jgi:hypothetical protein